MATLNLSLPLLCFAQLNTPQLPPYPLSACLKYPPAYAKPPYRTSIEEQAETPMPCFGGESYRCHQFTLFIICIPSLYSVCVVIL